MYTATAVPVEFGTKMYGSAWSYLFVFLYCVSLAVVQLVLSVPCVNDARCDPTPPTCTLSASDCGTSITIKQQHTNRTTQRTNGRHQQREANVFESKLPLASLPTSTTTQLCRRTFFADPHTTTPSSMTLDSLVSSLGSTARNVGSHSLILLQQQQVSLHSTGGGTHKATNMKGCGGGMAIMQCCYNRLAHDKNEQRTRSVKAPEETILSPFNRVACSNSYCALFLCCVCVCQRHHLVEYRTLLSNLVASYKYD